MKYINKRILKWLMRISKYLIRFCPTVQYIWSNSKLAEYRHFVFFLTTAILLFIATSTTWFNWPTIVAILIPSNNMFVLRGAVEYCKFTCLCGIFIFLCLLYITYFLYLDKRAELPSQLVGSLIYLLLFCIVIVGTVWCLFIYYGYVCIIQINIIYSLESLTDVWLIGIVFSALICLVSVCILANIYGKKYPALIIIRIVATLFFFNLVIAHIFGTFLYFDCIFFQAVVFNSEVYIYVVLTICYLCYLFTREDATAHLEISEWYILLVIAGFALGLRLCFYTTVFDTCLLNNVLDFFFIDFVRAVWVVCLFYSTMFNIFWTHNFDQKRLNKGFISILVFMIFTYLGLLFAITLSFASLGLVLPPITPDVWLQFFLY